MKTLIVYYSFSGNNELLAKELQDWLECDIYQIAEKRRRSKWSIFLDVFFKRTPKIEALPFDLKTYSQVIFIAPIWIGQIASPLATFLRKEKENLIDYSFITFCGSTEGLHEKIVPQLCELTGMFPTACEEFGVNELNFTEKNSSKAAMNYQLTPTDLKKFDERIERFLQASHVVEA